MRETVLIIAEAGVNHNGNLEMALELIDKAAEAGADVVKFQTFKAENLVSESAQKAEYQISNTSDKEESQFAMLKKLEIKEDWYPLLMERCKQREIEFLSTGFDEDSIDFLDSLNLSFYKIPSGEITNKPYLKHIAKKGKPIVLSTGMCDLKEIEDALGVLEENGISREQVVVLHCNTEYPTPMKDVNLLAMNHISRELGVKIGYSDHTLGIEVSVGAVALGARVIEKHFTLDRNLPGPDHAASLEPKELGALVRSVRNMESAISGSGIKEPSESELKNREIARKSIHLNKELEAGHVIKMEDLVMLRPAIGISPMQMDEVLGRRLIRNLPQSSLINKEDLE
jgi:N-acetylneuraminate synthase/N,N'-diacetyllegionaminate synthase